MKYLLTIAICVLISCGQKETKDIQDSYNLSTKDIAKYESMFTITSETDHVNEEFKINKCNINIELKKKLSKDELTDIAHILRKSRNTYDNLWIFYHLKGMKEGSGAWATSHFNPKLEVCILGLTENDEKKINSIIVEGKIIGKWEDLRPYVGSIMLLYKEDNKVFMKYIFAGGSSIIQEFILKKIGGKNRYELKENFHKEYYIIEKSGNLGMYGKNGKFGEAFKKD